jgi:hypothetical protein
MLQQLAHFFSQCTQSVASLVKVTLLSRFFIRMPEQAEANDECIVLGNGPSLSQTLKEDYPALLSRKLVCVNLFVASPEYEKLQPRYYILNAPEYFSEKPVSPLHEEYRNTIFSGIAQKTTWTLFVFIPSYARNSSVWKKQLQSNPNVKICFYNTTPVEGFEWLTSFLFKLNLGMPRPHNVLVPGIFLALNMGYKKVYITGADHSWHEELIVNEQNQVTINHNHFYDAKPLRMGMMKMDGSNFKIHDILRKLYLSFLGYYFLKEYAQRIGATIYNASKKSYIDAFERVSFK